MSEVFTHQEIADQLYYKYYYIVEDGPNPEDAANKCAMIHIESMLDEARKVSKIMYGVFDKNPLDLQMKYWNNVKEALENR